MAIRVYPALHPVVNFRRKETPRLAYALAEWVGGDNAVTGHLLYGPMVDAEHAPDLAGVNEIFDPLMSLSGPKVWNGHCFLLCGYRRVLRRATPGKTSVSLPQKSLSSRAEPHTRQDSKANQFSSKLELPIWQNCRK